MDILIVDDSMIVQVMLRKILAKWGHTATCVASGEEALQILLGKNSPTVAIIDWEMPGISGLEVCQKVRQSKPELRHYLILLTANDSKEHIKKAYQAGADQYLIKPFDNDQLQQLITIAEQETQSALSN